MHFDTVFECWGRRRISLGNDCEWLDHGWDKLRDKAVDGYGATTYSE